MAQTKLGLYNDALLLLGQRALSSDTEAREPRYDLDNLYDNGGVDYCLEMGKPRYAAKIALVTGITPTAVTSYAFQVDLPDADFLALDGLFADGKLEQRIQKFYREGDYILTDFENVYVRYIVDFATSGLTNMTPSFGRVVSAYFAREMSVKMDPDSYDSIDGELTNRLTILDKIETGNEPDVQGLLPTVLTIPWMKIYNDALLILGVDAIASISDDSIRKNKLDLARDAKIVESVLEDNGWGFGSQSDQIFFDPGIEPAWGYQYACQKPADLHRMDGVYSDEFFRNPIREYIDEDGYIFSSHQTIYIEYVSTSFLTDPALWPAYFGRMVAGRMAVDAGKAIMKHHPEADLESAANQYINRRKEAMSTDAINSPPKIIGQGSWSRTRRDLHSGRRDRP
jgi:hypothetical protein